MASAKIKCSALVFVPIAAASAPANSLYSDSGNSNSFSNKNDAGSPAVVQSSASDAFSKLAKNFTGVDIPAFTPVSKASDGSIVPADSDSGQGQQPYGVTLELIVDNTFGRVGLVGRNVPGALTGLGFLPGQDVYISQTAGYTNDPNSFTGNDDSIILIGIADCADNLMSATVTDLVMCRQVMVRP